MKKLLSLLILLSPLYVQAVNYLSFGGGNYVYAEQDNLYFNLDTYAFDNRKWSYDGEKFTSSISIKMDLKTKYTNDWYDEILANKKSDGLMYANYIKQPFSSKNQGGYQKVVIPAIAWGIGGFVARSAAWSAFRQFAAKAVGSSASRYVALGTFFSLLAADDIDCNSAGCTKTYNYAYVSNIDAPAFSSPIRVTESDFVDSTRLRTIVENKATKNFKLGNNSFELVTPCTVRTSTVSCMYLSGGSYSLYSIELGII